MKFLVFVICSSLLFASAFSFVVQGEKSCTADNRVLKHNEIGPAPLGECNDVQCVNGELRPYIGCGLIKLNPSCPPNAQIEDLTKLYPECCTPADC